MSDQQAETLEYFRKHAKHWQVQSAGEGTDEVNVTRQRNDYVLRVLGSRPSTRRTLDVACGTGELVIEIARRGIRALGIDFADDMISISKEAAAKAGIPAEFRLASIFDANLEDESFDAISANGFIEYISLPQLREFFSSSHRALAEGGSFVVASRNRLFNVFSLNDFTRMELSLGQVENLVKESLALATANDVNDLDAVVPAAFPPADLRHPATGIDVAIRHQYTPVQLMNLVREAGFTPRHIGAVHIHGVNPRAKNARPQIHVAISNLLQQFSDEDLSLVPSASTFMLHAVKERQ